MCSLTEGAKYCKGNNEIFVMNENKCSYYVLMD